MKFLVTQTTYFFDPHGTPDEGGTYKFITENPVYEHVNPEHYFFSDTVEDCDSDDPLEILAFLEENKSNEDNLYGEDGYNCEAVQYEVQKISDEQAADYQSIIDAYNSI